MRHPLIGLPEASDAWHCKWFATVMVTGTMALTIAIVLQSCPGVVSSMAVLAYVTGRRR